MTLRAIGKRFFPSSQRSDCVRFLLRCATHIASVGHTQTERYPDHAPTTPSGCCGACVHAMMSLAKVLPTRFMGSNGAGKIGRADPFLTTVWLTPPRRSIVCDGNARTALPDRTGFVGEAGLVVGVFRLKIDAIHADHGTASNMSHCWHERRWASLTPNPFPHLLWSSTTALHTAGWSQWFGEGNQDEAGNS